MPRKPAADPPRLSAKDIWVNEFVRALMNLREDLGPKFATTIAVNEWPQSQSVDAAKAAKVWVSDQSRGHDLH